MYQIIISINNNNSNNNNNIFASIEKYNIITMLSELKIPRGLNHLIDYDSLNWENWCLAMTGRM